MSGSCAGTRRRCIVTTQTNNQILDRFIEAVATGKACRTRLSLTGLGLLTRHNLWPEAMRRVVKLGAAHTHAQGCYLDNWMRVGWLERRLVGDDDLFFTSLRVLLPRYEGPAMQLYRGSLASEPLGVSWSRGYHNALKFALYGLDNVDPHRLHPNYRGSRVPNRKREGAVVLRTEAQPEQIICAPCLLGKEEGEYIVDPRGLKTGVIFGPYVNH
jgi:hypothetical protein